MDLSAWLHGLGLGQYEQAFRDNAVEPDVLLQLTAEDLRELGVVPVGHRRKLLDAIAALRVSASPASDNPREATSLVDPIGERRQVTVLFADLAGYTAWGQELDAEEIHALLEEFFDHGNWDGVERTAAVIWYRGSDQPAAHVVPAVEDAAGRAVNTAENSSWGAVISISAIDGAAPIPYRKVRVGSCVTSAA